MTNVVGYARVSPSEQHQGAQEAQLRAAGADRVFVDHGESSRAQDRPQWLACLEALRAGEILLVAALDRIAGSEAMAIATIHELAGRQINIKSLTEPAIDTTPRRGRRCTPSPPCSPGCDPGRSGTTPGVVWRTPEPWGGSVAGLR